MHLLFHLALMTIHWLPNVSKLLAAFIYYHDLPMEMILYHTMATSPKYVTCTGLYLVQATITNMYAQLIYDETII